MTLGVHVEENAVRRSQGKFSENIGTEEKKQTGTQIGMPNVKSPLSELCIS